jgi:hypothetical protein
MKILREILSSKNVGIDVIRRHHRSTINLIVWLTYTVVSSLLFNLTSEQIGLNAKASDVKLLVNLPLVALLLGTWIWFCSNIELRVLRMHVGLSLIVLYFAVPIQLFLPNFQSDEPEPISLAKFSFAQPPGFGFSSIFSLTIWITLGISLITISYLRLKKIRKLAIIPICMILNSFIGLFNNGINNAYSWAPSWLNPWTAFTYGNSVVGVVNSDEPIHRALTILFSQGQPENLMMVRRSFPYFLASPLSPVIDNVIIFQVLNCIFLLLLLVNIRQFLLILNLKQPAINLILIVVATCPQIIFCQNQSNGYFVGIVLSSLILFLTSRILIEGATKRNLVLFSITLIFASMSYDMILNGVVIVLLLRMKRVISQVQAVVILFVSSLSGFIYEAYVDSVAQIDYSKANSDQIGFVIKNIRDLILDFDLYLVYTRIQGGLIGFIFANSLLFGTGLIFIFMLTKVLNWKNETTFSLELVDSMKAALIVNLAAHIFWNLGNGWQFNIPRLTAGIGLFLLVVFLVLLSQDVRQLPFRLVSALVIVIQLIVLLPSIFNSYGFTWLVVTGGY